MQSINDVLRPPWRRRAANLERDVQAGANHAGERESALPLITTKLLQGRECSNVPCMDGARVARENLGISAKRSGAAMYSAFERSRCGCWP